jgi:hypothetical protein
MRAFAVRSFVSLQKTSQLIAGPESSTARSTCGVT